jgi:hypothetical protein
MTSVYGADTKGSPVSPSRVLRGRELFPAIHECPHKGGYPPEQRPAQQNVQGRDSPNLLVLAGSSYHCREHVKKQQYCDE